MYFLFKQKTAYEMRISDWSSDVCSSDLAMYSHNMVGSNDLEASKKFYDATFQAIGGKPAIVDDKGRLIYMHRSEEHTSELQSLMRISYAVFCLKKKNYYRDVQYSTRQHHNRKVDNTIFVAREHSQTTIATNT